ncbi:MAG: hypothetical protein ABW164_10645 [Sphingobium sp.]
MILLSALLAASPLPGISAVPAPQAAPCASPHDIPEPWTSWFQSGEMQAGTQTDGAPSLILGQPVLAFLTPVEHVYFPVSPGKDGGQGFGGIFTVATKVAARIGIALSNRAWVDILGDRGARASVDHGHGSACTDIRKIVWFDLPPGRHVVQVAGSREPALRIMAADARANQPVR